MGVERLENGRWPSALAAKVSGHTSARSGICGEWQMAHSNVQPGCWDPLHPSVHSSWAEGVMASICKFEISLGTMKVLDVELDGSSLAH